METMSRDLSDACLFMTLKPEPRHETMQAFLHDICRIPRSESNDDWTTVDRESNTFCWWRAEFTEQRGVAHFHSMARLPNTLETGVLGEWFTTCAVHELK